MSSAPSLPAVREWPASRVAMVLFLAVFLLYLPSLGNGFVWDDDAYVTDNLTLRTPGGWERIWAEPQASPQYYPLVFSTFWLEFRLWGLHPFGYHLVNIALHAANAVWVWWLLRRLRIPGALLAGLLFGLHPVQVETAAWVSERKNLLSAFFYCAALACSLRWFGLAEPAGRDRRWRWYAAALGCFVLALLGKTVACSLPAAVLILIWWKRGRIAWREVGWLVPFFAIGLALGLHTAWLEKVHVGAHGAEWGFSWGMRCWIAGRAVLFYLSKLAWPDPLVFIYPRWMADPSVLQMAAAPAAVLLVLAALWLGRRRWGRGPLAACLFFLVTLFPALGFVDLFPMRYSFVADHFQYLACAGPLALVAAGAALAADRFRWGTAARTAAILLLALPLAAKTVAQQRVYRDSFTLSEDIVAHNPTGWIGHRNLGDGFVQRGDPRRALAEYDAADMLHPNDPPLHVARGVLKEKMGDWAGARRDDEAAVALDPASAAAWNNLGALDAHQGQWAAALPRLEKAAALDPRLIPARYNLAVTLQTLGRPDAAAREYEAALALDPSFAAARAGLEAVRRAR